MHAWSTAPVHDAVSTPNAMPGTPSNTRCITSLNTKTSHALFAANADRAPSTRPPQG